MEPRPRRLSIRRSSTASNVSINQDYTVEGIVDRRIHNGMVQYLIKWKNYDSSQNTWEPIYNMKCTSLLKKFEKEAAIADRLNKRSMSTQTSIAEEEKYGFARGLKPKYITGCLKHDDELLFAINWENCDAEDIVAGKEAKLKCPQLVIQYLEQTIMWTNRKPQSDSSESEET